MYLAIRIIFTSGSPILTEPVISEDTANFWINLSVFLQGLKEIVTMTRFTFGFLMILIVMGGPSHLHSQVIFTGHKGESLIVKAPGSAFQEIYRDPDKRFGTVRGSSRPGWLAAIGLDLKARDAEGQPGHYIFIFHNRNIVDRIKGKVVKGLGGTIKEFEWSPEDDQLVYIEGEYLYDTLVGRSLWLYDIGKRETRKLLGGGEDEYLMDVTWAKFDGNIYLWISSYEGWKVYKVDSRTGQRTLTEYQAINFSPNGEYYFKESLEGTSGVLFRRKTNERILETPMDGMEFVFILGWGVSPEGECLLYLQDGHLNVGILNCDRGILEKKIARRGKSMPGFDGREIFWYHREPDGRLQLLDVD